MKKILSCIFVFLLCTQITFSNFETDTKISVANQKTITTAINSIYPEFVKNISQFNDTEQITKINIIIESIDKLLSKNNSITYDYILNYLKYLLEETEKNIAKQVDENICMQGYILKDDTCIKDENYNSGCKSNQHKEGGFCVDNEKVCNIANGYGTQKWDGYFWSKCDNFVCDNGYKLFSEQCIPDTSGMGESGLDNYVDSNIIVPGSTDKLILSFSLKADEVANIIVSSIKPVQTGNGVPNSYVNNYRLYKDNVLVKTSNNLDFSGLDLTIYKNQSVEFKIIADFSNAISTSSTFGIRIPAYTGIIARNATSSRTIPVEYDITSKTFIFSDGGKVNISQTSSQIKSSLITPGYNENSLFRFEIKSSDDDTLLTDLYITNIARNSVSLINIIKSSSITIGNKSFEGDILANEVIHFGFGGNGLELKKDDINTGEVKLSFFDSSSNTNTPIQLAIMDGTPNVAVNGTYNGARIISKSNGDIIQRKGGDIKGNEHLLVRSKPTISYSPFSPSSTDLYKFTVTADNNRKIALDKIILTISGTADVNGATVSVYRDSNGGAANFMGSKVISSSNVEIDLSTSSASNEISAGSTTTFYVEIIGGNDTSSTKRREVRITNLSYKNDVAGANPIWLDNYGNGIPTETSSYIY